MVLTTGQCAKEIGVSARTVCKWCDEGLLESFRIPHANSNVVGHRRILLENWVKFKARHFIKV